MTGQPTPHLFCFGMGFSARALANRLKGEGWKVSGTCRSPSKLQALKEAGIAGYLFDGAAPMAHAVEILQGVTHILLSIPPDADGDPVLRLHGPDIVRMPNLQWLGYLSTTGVYGDRQGDWVDETTPPAPTTPRGAKRLMAETGWLESWTKYQLPIHIFRLAGIYGPGRNQLETILAGDARRIIKKDQLFSRIHRDDIVQILAASMAKPRPGGIYNLCDDEAAPPQDVISYAAGLLNQPAPPEIPFEDAALSPMAQSFYAENKRVRNNLIKTELGVRLIYPTYREGLQALLSTLG